VVRVSTHFSNPSIPIFQSLDFRLLVLKFHCVCVHVRVWVCARVVRRDQPMQNTGLRSKHTHHRTHARVHTHLCTLPQNSLGYLPFLTFSSRTHAHTHMHTRTNPHHTPSPTQTHTHIFFKKPKITKYLFTFYLNSMCKSNPVCLIHQWSVIFWLASYVQ